MHKESEKQDCCEDLRVGNCICWRTAKSRGKVRQDSSRSVQLGMIFWNAPRQIALSHCVVCYQQKSGRPGEIPIEQARCAVPTLLADRVPYGHKITGAAQRGETSKPVPQAKPGDTLRSFSRFAAMVDTTLRKCPSTKKRELFDLPRNIPSPFPEYKMMMHDVLTSCRWLSRSRA